MLNEKQRKLVNDFIVAHPELEISWMDFVDGKLEINVRHSQFNPFTPDQWPPGQESKLYTTLENRVRNAGQLELKYSFSDYVDWCENSELE